MIKCVVGNNVKRESMIIDANTTLRQAFEAAGIDYASGVSNLDGATLQPGDLDKTFTDFGIVEKTFLFSVVKANNA